MKLSQVSVRDLLLVTVIVALAVSWCLDRTGLQAQLKRAQGDAQRWQTDATVYRTLLRELPPTGIDLPTSLSPSVDP
jgi:hypothetical protein